VSTLSPETKIEWAAMHRQRGNTLFQKGNYKEAMDVFLTCLVAIETKDGSSSGTDTDTTTVSATNVSRNEGEGEDSTKTINGDPKTTVENQDPKDEWTTRTDAEIKLPILLNLAACTLKMGMHQKTEKFCNFAIMEMSCGKTSTKAYFRRGWARMLMGSYRGAREDFDMAM